MSLVDPSCFLGLSREERRQQIYEALSIRTGVGDPDAFYCLSQEGQEQALYSSLFIAGGGALSECTEIAGATDETYELQAGDEGFYIRGRELAENSEGTAPYEWSEPTGIIGPEGASINTSLNDITDTQSELGWEAGRMTQATPGSFTTATMAWNGSAWIGDGSFSTPQVSSFQFAPADNAPVSAAARYTASVGDEVLITFSGTSGAGSGGLSIRVYHNADVILSHLNVSNGTFTSNTTRTLLLGDTIILEIDPLAGFGSDAINPISLTLAST